MGTMLIVITPMAVIDGVSVSKPSVMCESHAMWFIASLPIDVRGDDTLISALARGGYSAKRGVDDEHRSCELCRPPESFGD